MSKKENFIRLVGTLMENVSIDTTEYADALIYYEALKLSEDKEKPEISDKGLAILEFMQNNVDTFRNMFSAKIVGEGMEIATRSASPTMRAMVTGGFLEKIADKPAIYSLTEKGKNYSVSAN